jgi:DNA primase
MEPLSNAARKSLESLLQYPLDDRGRAYLESRGLLDVATDRRLGAVPSAGAKPEHRRYAGRLVIPTFSARGTVCDMALRCTDDHDCKVVDCRKYMFMPGIPKRLIGLSDVTTAGPELHIAEGHADWLSLKACGLPAVGVAGVNAWKAYHRRILAGFERIFFWAQSDDNGQSEGLGERVRAALPGVVSLIMVPGHEDVNTYLVKHGKQAVLSLIPSEDDEPEGETDGREDQDVIPF